MDTLLRAHIKLPSTALSQFHPHPQNEESAMLKPLVITLSLRVTTPRKTLQPGTDILATAWSGHTTNIDKLITVTCRHLGTTHTTSTVHKDKDQDGRTVQTTLVLFLLPLAILCLCIHISKEQFLQGTTHLMRALQSEEVDWYAERKWSPTYKTEGGLCSCFVCVDQNTIEINYVDNLALFLLLFVVVVVVVVVVIDHLSTQRLKFM